MAALAIASLAAAVASPAHAQPGKESAPGFKTRLTNPGAVAGFRDALYGFDDSGKARGGKAPADAQERLRKLQALAGPAKGEIKSFAARLRAAGEVEAYEAAVYAAASRAGAPTLMSDLKAVGGPYALLTKADALLDEMIADRRKVSQNGTAARLLESLGLTVAVEARLKSTACGAFWWAISWGYATAHAYRSCYY